LNVARCALFVGIVVSLFFVERAMVVAWVHAISGFSLAPIRPYLLILILFLLILFLANVLIATWVVARLEHRSIFSYGFGLTTNAKGFYAEGLGIGVIAGTFLGVALAWSKSIRIRSGPELQGADWLWVLVWAAIAIIMAIAEEGFVRGYLIYSLSRVIGFWPSALVSTALFLAVNHDGLQNPLDVVNLTGFGLLACFVLARSGSLWLGAGFHALFDFVQYFVVGSMSNSPIPHDRLFYVVLIGPDWMTGGQSGIEASIFMWPVALGVLAYVVRRFPSTSSRSSIAS
jgi:uncharacterized protein